MALKVHGIQAWYQESKDLPIHACREKMPKAVITYTRLSRLTPSPLSSTVTLAFLSLDLRGLGLPIEPSGTAVPVPPLEPHSTSASPRLLELSISRVSTQTVRLALCELSFVRSTLVPLNDFWLSSELRVKSLLIGYLSKAFELREPMLLLALDFGSMADGCLGYPDWRRRDSAKKSEGEARLKTMRNRGRRVGMQAAMMMTFSSILRKSS